MVKLTKEDFEKIMAFDKSELKILFKLTRAHLDCVGSQRQNVRLATQLFSMSVAKAFLYLFPGEEGQAKHDAILLINDYFDVMNSRIPFHKLRSKSAFGNNLAEQYDKLDQMEKFLEEFEVIS